MAVDKCHGNDSKVTTPFHGTDPEVTSPFLESICINSPFNLHVTESGQTECAAYKLALHHKEQYQSIKDCCLNTTAGPLNPFLGVAKNLLSLSPNCEASLSPITLIETLKRFPSASRVAGTTAMAKRGQVQLRLWLQRVQALSLGSFHVELSLQCIEVKN
ncbi:hypothetical protein AAY473_036702 [Plecturocebus cupreus]